MFLERQVTGLDLYKKVFGRWTPGKPGTKQVHCKLTTSCQSGVMLNSVHFKLCPPEPSFSVRNETESTLKYRQADLYFIFLDFNICKLQF